tara:strand:- start:5185 stop:5985 length:801 start_codon:yes stop_codon:yes gene_type:complete
MPLSIQIAAMIGGIGGAPSVAPSPPPTSGFKFLVDTKNGGSATNTFVLPLITSGIYDFEVDWGDGTTDTITNWNATEKTHVYSVGGTYTIECTGTLRGFQFALAGDRLKIIEIFNWGGSNLDLGGPTFSFSGCSNLTVSATNSPANTGNIIGCFYLVGSSSFTGGIAGWDMSNTQSCLYMCYNASSFNEDISGWDVSNITDFGAAFSGTAMSVANYDALLIAWSAQTVQSGVTFGISAQYTGGGTAAAARATLVTKGWTIVDGGSV